MSEWKPLICENIPSIEPRALRWAAQLGLDALALGGSHADPQRTGELTVEGCRELMDTVEAGGLKVGIVMLHNVTDAIIHAGPERDRDLEPVLRSIRAAGEAGISVLEYNFYNHRAIEGYGKEVVGRGGCRYVDFDATRLDDLEPLDDAAALGVAETWANLRYFLEAVVPVAEEAGVRLALHPNDPPPPVSRGAAQVVQTVEGFQKVIDLVPSWANGITFCQGSVAEWGADVVAAIHQLGDRIHHVHYRNPRGVYPHYVETWIDEGDLDMLAAMKAFRDIDYRYTLCSDHVPIMTDEVEFGMIGRAFNHGYIKAMIQAANRC